jgi:hypothetical protein
MMLSDGANFGAGLRRPNTEALRRRLRDSMLVMRIQRLVAAAALGTVALTMAACSSGTAVPPTTSIGIGIGIGIGEVCGVTALAGGPPSAVGVQNRALLRVCPSGHDETTSKFSLMASNGKEYIVRTYDYQQWSANLPAGTYRAIDRPGCGMPGRPFVVRAGKTVKGVVVWFGCDYS